MKLCYLVSERAGHSVAMKKSSLNRTPTMATSFAPASLVPDNMLTAAVPIPADVLHSTRQSSSTPFFNPLHLSIIDYCPKERPDDGAYKRSRNLWQHVPRGCADVVAQTATGKIVWQGYLRGLPKFGYEEDIDQWSFKAATITQWVFTTKENGECFHFMCSPRLPEGRIFVFGSKNVHAAVMFTTDDEFWRTEWTGALRQKMYQAERFSYAFSLVQQLVNDVRAKPTLQSHWSAFLDWAQNCTVIFEACDLTRAEHLVEYDVPLIACLAIRHPFEKCFTALHPTQQRTLFQQFGFDVPRRCETANVGDTETIRRLQKEFAEQENCEGVVRSMLNEKNETVAMVKEKNYDYVRRRAVREKVKQGVSSNALVQRLRNLHVPHSLEFAKESLEFNAWVQLERRAHRLDDMTLDKHYMGVEAKFRALSEADRQVCLQKWNECTNQSKLVVVVGAPCQGAGKTTFSVSLQHVLETLCNLHTVRICQDDFGKRPAFMAALKKANDDSKTDVVIIDKWNGKANRDEYWGLFPNGRFVFVGFYHPSDEKGSFANLVEHCIRRVHERKDNHPCLRMSAMSPTEVTGLLRSFSARWKWPEEDEETLYLALISLSVLDDTQRQLEMALYDLQLAHLITYDASKLHDSILAGMTKHRAYEASWVKNPAAIAERPVRPRRTLYWKIELDRDEVKKMWSDLGSVCQPPPNCPVLSSFHVTLVYFNHKKKLSVEEEAVYARCDATWAAREGRTVKVIPIELVWDNKAFAVRVQTTEDLKPHMQRELHVTLAHVANVRPVYANDMMEHPLYAKKIEHVELTGRVERVYSN